MKADIEVRYAAHPDDVKHWDTDLLRREHLVGSLFNDNAVTMVYTLYDRMVAGGAKPAGDTLSDLDFKEALYLGSGDREIIFESVDKNKPALFYFNPTPAHLNYPDRKVSKNAAISAEMGSSEAANHRVINKMILSQVLESCQLQMGIGGESLDYGDQDFLKQTDLRQTALTF